MATERTSDAPSSLAERSDSMACDIDAHLSTMPATCGLIYRIADKLTSKARKEGDRRLFWRSAEGLSKRWSLNERTVRRGFEELVRNGFFVEVDSTPFHPTVYQFFNHDDWAERHPGRCLEKLMMPWEGEGDVLGQRLHRASGGRVKFLEFQVKALRSLPIDEDEIVKAFNIYMEVEGRHKRCRDAAAGFYISLKQSLQGAPTGKCWSGRIALDEHFGTKTTNITQ